MNIADFLDYEIRSSWWAKYVWWGWGHELTAAYFAWKVKRKYTRYIESRLGKAMAERKAQLGEK